MGDKVEISLRDGTLVRHKNKGYEGKIEGTTAIKTCFTRGGNLLDTPISKEPFQYRVVVSGMSLRYIAPVDDLEILDEAVEIRCVRCNKPFYTKPGVAAKACGRCACGDGSRRARIRAQARHCDGHARCDRHGSP